MQTEKIFGRKGSEKKTVLLGHIETLRVYVTERRPEHLFRLYNGFGLSNSLIVRLFRAEVDMVHFKYFDPEGLIVYAVSLKDFMDYGHEVDYDEKQTICSIGCMRIVQQVSTKSKVVAEKVINDGKQ